MEALMFMADVICIILLVMAVVKSGRTTGEPSLGLFAYKQSLSVVDEAERSPDVSSAQNSRENVRSRDA